MCEIIGCGTEENTNTSSGSASSSSSVTSTTTTTVTTTVGSGGAGGSDGGMGGEGGNAISSSSGSSGGLGGQGGTGGEDSFDDSCVNRNITTVNYNAVGNTQNFNDNFNMPCNSGAPRPLGTKDYAWSYTAQYDGFYTFDTIGSNFDTFLYVLSECEPNGYMIACNDDIDGAENRDSLIDHVFLHENQSVVIVLDAFRPSESGAFSFNITSHPLIDD